MRLDEQQMNTTQRTAMSTKPSQKDLMNNIKHIPKGIT